MKPMTKQELLSEAKRLEEKAEKYKKAGLFVEASVFQYNAKAYREKAEHEES
jgi:hypothetical protein